MSEDESGSFGLACDGNCVVVDLRNYRFQNRCLITDEPVEGDHLPMHFFTCEPLSQPATVGDVKSAIESKWNIGPLCVVNIAVRAPQKVPHPERSSVPGHCLLVMGVVTSILGVVMAFVGLIVWQWPALIIFIPLLVGATLVVAGVRLLIKLHRPLSIERFQDGFVWLGGVHPGIRDALPPWQDSVAAIALRSRMARRRPGLGGVVLIIGLLYAAFQYENIFEAIDSRSWPSTQGMITTSEIVTRSSFAGRNGPRRTEFEIQVEYSFAAARIGYSGSRIGFHRPSGFRDRETATRRKESAYGVGNPVTVYYSARDPARCTLAPATEGEILTLVAPMAFTLVFAACYFIAGVSTLRRTAVSRCSVGTNGNPSVPSENLIDRK